MNIKLSKKQRQFLINSFIICSFISFAAIIFLKLFFPNKSTQDIATSIGGILGTTFSFFGSVLVYLALKAQIDANEQVRKQFKKQEEKEQISSFETTFFNLINYHLNLVNSIEKLYDRTTIMRSPKLYLGGDDNEFIAKGKIVFEIEYNKISNYLDDYYYQDRIYERDFDDVLEFREKESRMSVFKKVYSVYYTEQVDGQFGNYFRNLYRLFKIIDSYNFSNNFTIDFEKKYFYTSIIRAQFSDYELKWIFINGLSTYGLKFKKLIEKYSLLKNIDRKDEILCNYVKYYEQKAFNNLNE